MCPCLCGQARTVDARVASLLWYHAINSGDDSMVGFNLSSTCVCPLHWLVLYDCVYCRIVVHYYLPSQFSVAIVDTALDITHLVRF